ncbi:MAG: hypothetical protein M3P16_04425 [Chloroflexota bacterium]|nr:hypothetical protein [Chloroflexota bacterium]
MRRPLATLRALTFALRTAPFGVRVLSITSAALAIGLAGAVGGGAASVTAVLALALVAVAAVVFAEPEDRVCLVGAAVLAFLLRAILAAALEGYLQRTAAGSVFSPDEALWIGVGRALADHWRNLDASFDATDAHLRMLNVQLIAAIFWTVGPNVLVLKLVHCFFGAFAPLMLYRAMRNVGLPGARLATLVVLFFPSLLLWSMLALKDAYVEVCLLGAVWTSSEFIRRRSYWWILTTAAFLVALESVRRYGYFAIALAWLAVPMAFASWRERIRPAVAITATVALLFAIFDPLSDAGPNPLYQAIFVRGAGAEGARSAFVEPLPVVRGNPGDQFVVAVAGQTANPDATPRAVSVSPGVEVVIEGSSPRGQGPFVVVRPGDTIVVTGGAGASPPATTPGRTPEVALLNPGAKSLVGSRTSTDPDAASVSGSLMTNLRNLPLGMLYVGFGPFPWTARSLSELATIPEMLLWYLLVPLSISGAISLIRRRDFGFAHGAVFLGGMFIALSLIASNTGTLIRSRAMIIPFVIAFAAIAAAPLLRERLPAKVRWIVG